MPVAQLYDMAADLGETRNLLREHPAVAKAMMARLRELVDAGRSTPGPRQANDACVDVLKLDTLPGVDEAAFDDW